MGSNVECRTCLGKFCGNETIHLDSKILNQESVLQAIEEVASIKVSEHNGLPNQICNNCFISLESSVTFRKQIISTDAELKRRVNPEVDPLNVFDNKLDTKTEDTNNKIDFKEENESGSLVAKKENIIPFLLVEKFDAETKLEVNSDSDWNNFSDDTNSSSNSHNDETKTISILRKSKGLKVKSKSELGYVRANSFVDKNNTLRNRKKNSFKDIDVKLNNSENGSIKKSLDVSENEESDFNEDFNNDDNFSDMSFEEKQIKKTLIKPTHQAKKFQKKRRVSKKHLENIPDTSSDSDSDSDIPLEEIKKELQNLENKTAPKVRKRRVRQEQPNGPVLCPICGKLFKAKQNFNSHMTTVHRKKPEKPEKISCLCPDCGRVITGTRQNFVAHRRYHHSDKAQVKKRFTCDVCPRKFYREKNLIIHQRIHKGEKGYVCELCPDKSYTQIGGLILHKRKVHLKKPSCTCNYCGKQFYEKHYLETHIRQWHTGERPFSCEICGKSFSCNGTLLRHRKDSHGEKQPCPKCGKMYTEGELRKHLKRHKIREEGIKRKKYTCEYCGTEMNFTSRKRHLLKQHGIMLRGRGETAERVPISRADAM